MKSTSSYALSIFSAVLLAACSGGGGDSAPASPLSTTTPVVTSSPPVSFTQKEVQAVVGLGLLITELTGSQSSSLLGFFGGFWQGISSSEGGSDTPVTNSCAVNGVGSGSVTFTTSKSGVYTGFRKGDYLITTYTNCDLGGNSLINGTARLTAVSEIANLVAGDFVANYEADLIDFSLNGVTHNGNINAATAVSNGSTNFNQMFDAIGIEGLRVNSGELTNLYSQGASFKLVDASAGSASRKLDGDIKVLTSTDNVTLLVLTSAPLLGNTNSGRFVATSGAITIKDSVRNLATLTSFSGTVATVNADSNKDDVLDLSFPSTWAELITFAP